MAAAALWMNLVTAQNKGALDLQVKLDEAEGKKQVWVYGGGHCCV